MARPEKPINWDEAERLMEAGCSGTEIAAYFDLHSETFYERVQKNYGMGFTGIQAAKRQRGCSLLRAAQFRKALKGDNTMLVWLGKNNLGQTDKEKGVDVDVDSIRKIAQTLRDLPGISQVERPALEAGQPLLHQRSEGEQAKIPDELGAKGAL